MNGIDQVLTDSQYAARNLFPSDPERFGQARIVNTPLIADGAPRARTRAPGAGADTRSLLGELGMDNNEIARLAEAGVIGLDASAERLVA